jgi:hypothetical protein
MSGFARARSEIMCGGVDSLRQQTCHPFAIFSPNVTEGALVLPEVTLGMIEASAILRPPMPWTLGSRLTTT